MFFRICDKGHILNHWKCVFNKADLNFYGYIQAIEDAPIPQNVDELRSFLGFVNYVSSFSLQLLQLQPCSRFDEKKSTKWAWKSRHQVSFDKLKELLTSQVLLQILSHIGKQKL